MFLHLIRFIREKESRTVGVIFCLNSLLFGNWITRIPDVKVSLGISEAELGLALLGAPAGALLIMPMSGWIIEKLSLGKANLWALLLFILCSFVPSLSQSLWGLFGALFLYGLTNAYLDIAMNAAASVVEGAKKMPIMSTCHGMWSLGAMIGSVTGSFFIGFGIAPQVHLILVALVTIVLSLPLIPTILQFKDNSNATNSAHVFTLPTKAILGLAIIAFCILMSEGAIADWSAVYMKDTLHSNPFLIGIAFSGYSLMMALGRFSGDAIIPKFGNKKIILGGALISVTGLLLALSFLNTYTAIIGFSLTGLGFSCIVPVVFSVSAKTPGMSAGSGIAAVATMGYTGFLAGPPFIGLIAEVFSLRLGLSIVVLLTLIVLVQAMHTKALK